MRPDTSFRARRVFSTLCAVLFVPFFLLTVFSACASVLFSSPDTLAESIVDDAYVALARDAAEEALLDQSLLYGIAEEDLYAALSDETLKDICQENVSSVLSALFSGEKYGVAAYPSEPFLTVIRSFVADLKEADPSVQIEKGADVALADECATLVAQAASPVRGSLYEKVLSGISSRVPASLSNVFKFLPYPLAAVSLVFFFAGFFLAEKKRRLFYTGAALFCAATVLFCLALFLVSSFDLRTLPLGEGILFSLVSSLFTRFAAPLKLVSILAFSLSTLVLILAIVLRVKQESVNARSADCAEDKTVLPEV